MTTTTTKKVWELTLGDAVGEYKFGQLIFETVTVAPIRTKSGMYLYETTSGKKIHNGLSNQGDVTVRKG
jgi:hypothetical protein